MQCLNFESIMYFPKPWKHCYRVCMSSIN